MLLFKIMYRIYMIGIERNIYSAQ